MEKYSLVSKFYVTSDQWKGTAYNTHSNQMNHQEIMESENKLHASIMSLLSDGRDGPVSEGMERSEAGPCVVAGECCLDYEC